MINLRKYKYVVIADGTGEKEKANVIACEDLHQAQDAFTQAMEQELDPMILEMTNYIEDSLCDRYGYPGELPEAMCKNLQDKNDVVKSMFTTDVTSLYKKIKAREELINLNKKVNQL
jgi:hypothetical protein